MLVAAEKILGILLILLLGFFITNRSWFKNGGPEIISKLVIKVALPISLYNNIVSKYSSREELLDIFKGLPIPFVSIGVTLVIAYIIMKLLKIDQSHKGLFINMFGLSNTVLIGMPVVSTLIGPDSATYNIIYYMANTIFFWTIGAYLLRKDAGCSEPMLTLNNFKQVFSPPFIGFLLGVTTVLIGIPLPSFVLGFTKDIAGISTPLSILFIGTVIRRIDPKSLKISKDMIILLLGRFILSPAIAYLICLPLPVPVMMKKVFILLAGMPVMTQASIMSKEYNADYEYASLMVTVTTVAMFVFIPIYSYLFEIIPL